MLSAFNDDNTWQIAAASALPVYGKLLEIPLNTSDIQQDLKFETWLNGNMSSLIISREELMDAFIPSVTRLAGNYPNPFNPELTISFNLEEQKKVILDIFNIKGQKSEKALLTKLSDQRIIILSGKGDNEMGQKAGSGVYFIRLEIDDQVITSKAVLMK